MVWGCIDWNFKSPLIFLEREKEERRGFAAQHISNKFLNLASLNCEIVLRRKRSWTIYSWRIWLEFIRGQLAYLG